MGTVKRFEDLDIWKESRALCNTIFGFTKKDSFSKDFDLKRQILRSSGSTMDNIVEGFEREGNREFVQFLSIAKGSCGESRSQLYRAFDFGYLSEEEFTSSKVHAENLSKRISGLIEYLKRSEIKGRKFEGR